MFKSLKDKLKSWISKTKEETEEVVETPKEEKKKPTQKKETKQKERKSEKKQRKEKPLPTKKKIKEDKENLKKIKGTIDSLDKKDKISPKKVKGKHKEEVKKETEEDTEEQEKPKESEEKEDKIIQEEVKKEKYIEPVKKFDTASQKFEPDIKATKELQEEKEQEKPKEKKGFFASLFGKKEEQESLSPIETEADTEEEAKERSLKTSENQVEEDLEDITKNETPTREPKKQGFSFFRKSLTEEKFEELFDELELILMQNNVAYEAIQQIKESLKEKLVGSSETDVEESLKESIRELLINPPNLIKQIKEKETKPFVILFAGINGAGKTTSIAKVTNLLKKNNLTVCLASADTFRAAAIEQLQIHADRLEVPLIKKDYGSDPASVGFDAIKYAQKNKIDVVLIDTAGRMNNRDTLMKEIEKISRVNSPDLKIFLGESITGNDATEQAKDFNDAIGIDGIILSKADVDEKGGTAISVSQVTGKPIYYLGTGQTYNDLEIFNKEKLLEKLFS